MSFQLSSMGVNMLQPTHADAFSGSYGVSNPMIHGSISQNPGFSHPLESSKCTLQQNKFQQELKLMRNVQGLHAPMRLAMELKAADNVGRHPFLVSSHIMKDVLLARDEEIGFEDILNTAEFNEQMGQPHAIVEKKVGLL